MKRDEDEAVPPGSVWETNDGDWTFVALGWEEDRGRRLLYLRCPLAPRQEARVFHHGSEARVFLKNHQRIA